MVNRLLQCVLLSMALAGPSAAHAHGGGPEVLGIAGSDGEGVPTTLRLNEGIALRRTSGWRFLCPALWRSDEGSPAASAPGQPVVIGGADGLYQLDPESGEVAAHPDPLAEGGVTFALRSSGTSVIGLRLKGDLMEVLEVTPDSVRVLHSDIERWDGIDVGEDFIALAHVSGGLLEILRLSMTGVVIERATASAPAEAVAARPRVVGDLVYGLVVTHGGLRSELGRIDGGAWVTLHMTDGSIAGPQRTGSGDIYLSSAGGLARFEDELVSTTGEAAIVTCLDEHMGESYACADVGLRRLIAGGLGKPLFDLSELLEPDPGLVPTAAAEMCTLQWQRYVLDLRTVGITPAPAPPPPATEADAGPVDGGPPTADGGPPAAGESDAGPADDAGKRTTRDAGPQPSPDATSDPADDAAAEAANTQNSTASSGCGCRVGARRVGSRASLLAALPWLLLWRRRRSPVSGIPNLCADPSHDA